MQGHDDGGTGPARTGWMQTGQTRTGRVSAIRACHWAVAVRLSASTPERRAEYAIRGLERPYPSVPPAPGRWAGAPTHPPPATGRRVVGHCGRIGCAAVLGAWQLRGPRRTPHVQCEPHVRMERPTFKCARHVRMNAPRSNARPTFKCSPHVQMLAPRSDERPTFECAEEPAATSSRRPEPCTNGPIGRAKSAGLHMGCSVRRRLVTSPARMNPPRSNGQARGGRQRAAPPRALFNGQAAAVASEPLRHVPPYESAVHRQVIAGQGAATTIVRWTSLDRAGAPTHPSPATGG